MSNEIEQLQQFREIGPENQPARSKARASLVARAESRNQANAKDREAASTGFWSARRLLIFPLAAVAISVGIAGASKFLGPDDIAISAGVGCYKTASLTADVIVLGPRENPVAACGQAWKTGPANGSGRFSKLTACSAEGEPVRVFPGGQAVCQRLGLEPLPAGFADTARTVKLTRSAVVEANRSAGPARGECVTPGHLAREVSSLIRSRTGARARIRIQGEGGCALPAMLADQPAGPPTVIIERGSRASVARYGE